MTWLCLGMIHSSGISQKSKKLTHLKLHIKQNSNKIIIKQNKESWTDHDDTTRDQQKSGHRCIHSVCQQLTSCIKPYLIVDEI